MPEEILLRHLDIEGQDQDERRESLGGSDSPVVLGVSPFMTLKELWMEKLGLAPPKETTDAMMRGNFLEAPVANLYEKITGKKVEIVKQKLVHPKYPWMTAHIDRRIMDDKRGPGVLEIKCPGTAYFGKCEREGLQEYYLVQTMHYLAVTGYKWASILVFNSEYMRCLPIFDITPNQKLISHIIESDKKFWEENILKQIEPSEPEVKFDFEPVNPGELINMDKARPGTWASLMKRYQEAAMIMEEADLHLESIREKIKAEMDQVGASVAEGSGGRIYWREQNGRLSLDKKAFAKGHPTAYEIYENYLKTGKPSRPFRAFFPRPILHE